MQVDNPTYFIPASSVSFEQSIKQSRFICYLGHGPSTDQIDTALSQIRNQHPKAHHVCWAFIAGPPNAAQRGMSDDGEPKGTAGRPMLQVLDHSGFGEIWAAVVRYFGGTKLGRGGLVRAYTSSVQQALDLVEPIQQQPLLQLRLLIDYNLLPMLEQHCREMNITILNRTFLEQVELLISVPQMLVGRFRDDLSQISSGSAHIKSD
jgi:uncharacterized YigZ family protein